MLLSRGITLHLTGRRAFSCWGGMRACVCLCTRYECRFEVGGEMRVLHQWTAGRRLFSGDQSSSTLIIHTHKTHHSDLYRERHREDRTGSRARSSADEKRTRGTFLIQHTHICSHGYHGAMRHELCRFDHIWTLLNAGVKADLEMVHDLFTRTTF